MMHHDRSLNPMKMGNSQNVMIKLGGGGPNLLGRVGRGLSARLLLARAHARWSTE